MRSSTTWRVGDVGIVAAATLSVFVAACGDEDRSDQLCGNGLIDGTELCDGSQLGGRDCTSVPGGHTGGDLRCSDTCTYDTSRCGPREEECGDDVREGAEECDGDDLGTDTCETVAGAGSVGGLACDATCTFDASGCTLEPSCGDGMKNGKEDCDGDDVGTDTCETVAGPGSTGDLACEPGTCLFETTGCTPAMTCAPAPTSELVLDVTDTGATGDDATDDTAAIQAAVDEVGGTGGTVLVPDGTFMIDTLTSVQLRSQMTFRMSHGAVLRAIPNESGSSSILSVESASDVNVVGGSLIGERDEHTGVSGEWGHGLRLYGATRVVVEGVTARNCWGDGFYVGHAYMDESVMTTDATFCSIVADDNRRQGMSIVSAEGVVVRDSIFTSTGGTDPQAGIDIEPNSGGRVGNVQILSSQFADNLGCGVLLWADDTIASVISDVTIDGNTVTGNAGAAGIALHATDGHVITNNVIEHSVNWGGISLDQSTGNVITGNTITSPNPIVGDDGGNTIEGNTFL